MLLSMYYHLRPPSYPPQVMLAEAGAIGPLVVLLQTGSEIARADALLALGLIAWKNDAADFSARHVKLMIVQAGPAVGVGVLGTVAVLVLIASHSRPSLGLCHGHCFGHGCQHMFGHTELR